MSNIVLDVISIVVSIFGLAFVGVQLLQIKCNRKKQYDNLRREKTVELVVWYTQVNKKATQATEKIVASLTDEQCRDLYDGTAFSVNKKLGEKICDICPRKLECRNDTGKQGECWNKDNATEEVMNVKDTVLYFLRDNIISYLNALECVLLAWQLGIVERKIIEEQFAFLDKKRQKERALEMFRSFAGGGKSYPAIEDFYLYLDSKRMKKAQEKFKDYIE